MGSSAGPGPSLPPDDMVGSKVSTRTIAGCVFGGGKPIGAKVGLMGSTVTGAGVVAPPMVRCGVGRGVGVDVVGCGVGETVGRGVGGTVGGGVGGGVG